MSLVSDAGDDHRRTPGPGPAAGGDRDAAPDGGRDAGPGGDRDADPGGDPGAGQGPGSSADAEAAELMSVLFDRGRPEDFAAVGSVLGRGRHTRERLLGLLCARDPGCDAYFFAGMLAELPLLPDEQFTALGLDDLEIAILRARFADWYRSILDGGPPG